jgi:hypothetical protein
MGYRTRSSELLAGATTVGFAFFTTWAVQASIDSVSGNAAKAAAQTLRSLTVGGATGFLLVWITGLYSSRGVTTQRQQVAEHVADYIFLVSTFVAAIALGAVFKDVSLLSVYQKSQRETLVDHDIMLTVFVFVWAVIWAILRTINTPQRRTIGKPISVPQSVASPNQTRGQEILSLLHNSEHTEPDQPVPQEGQGAPTIARSRFRQIASVRLV